MGPSFPRFYIKPVTAYGEAIVGQDGNRLSDEGFFFFFFSWWTVIRTFLESFLLLPHLTIIIVRMIFTINVITILYYFCNRNQTTGARGQIFVHWLEESSSIARLCRRGGERLGMFWQQPRFVIFRYWWYKLSSALNFLSRACVLPLPLLKDADCYNAYGTWGLLSKCIQHAWSVHTAVVPVTSLFSWEIRGQKTDTPVL